MCNSTFCNSRVGAALAPTIADQTNCRPVSKSLADRTLPGPTSPERCRELYWCVSALKFVSDSNL